MKASLWALPVLACLPLVYGLYDSVPDCALPCVFEPLDYTPCEFTNSTCLCGDMNYNMAVIHCVRIQCSVQQALITKNQTWADCNFTYHDEGATATWVPAFLFGTVTIFFAMRLLTKWLRMGTWGWDDMVLSPDAKAQRAIPQNPIAFDFPNSYPSGGLGTFQRFPHWGVTLVLTPPPSLSVSLCLHHILLADLGFFSIIFSRFLQDTTGFFTLNMEAIRKQASKLREQVARQQQAVLKQLGHFGIETVVVDEAEQRQLQNLYNSTRTAKHFQKDIVRGIEGFVSTSSKQMEIVRRMAEDCCKYGTENQSTGSPLARAALYFGNSHSSMEKERETLLGVFCDQVSEPLRVLITGAPLEDARHLTHRYERLRQEVESQAADVLRRQAKFRDPATSAESSIKLQSAEAKLSELKSAMMALGREATAAMLSVEAQQQRITFQRLLTMVEAERSYHQTVLATLEKLYDEMIMEKKQNESSSQPITMEKDVCVPTTSKDANSNGFDNHGHANQNGSYFIAKVIHPFDAQADGELGLSVDDYVVVRQVAPNGWSEGECKGTAGWFPSAYVERRDKAPASVINEEASLAMIPN